MRASNTFDTRLSKRTKHRPSIMKAKEMFSVCDRIFDGLKILSNSNKHDQTLSNSTKQGGQTVKCLVTKRCLMGLVANHFPFVRGFKLKCKNYNILNETRLSNNTSKLRPLFYVTTVWYFSLNTECLMSLRSATAFK